MSANSFGHLFVVHSFGESHGAALGAVVEGCPAGLEFDRELLNGELERRRPGFGAGVSQRKEPDAVEILSGVYQGRTLGTPIAMIVRNEDARSQDYAALAPRAGHADDVWAAKFAISDPRGGGRSSGRETVARVMGGAVAKMLLRRLVPDCKISSAVTEIGPDRVPAERAQDLLARAQGAGESFGAVVELRVQNPPPNLGQPVFNKLKADLGAAMLSIGASAGVEFGAGFSAASAAGTQFHGSESRHYGGIRGGISSGDQICLRVAFKPTSSILDVAKKGRHDPCVAIRAAVVCESMCALVLADHLLWTKLDRV